MIAHCVRVVTFVPRMQRMHSGLRARTRVSTRRASSRLCPCTRRLTQRANSPPHQRKMTPRSLLSRSRDGGAQLKTGFNVWQSIDPLWMGWRFGRENEFSVLTCPNVRLWSVFGSCCRGGSKLWSVFDSCAPTTSLWTDSPGGCNFLGQCVLVPQSRGSLVICPRPLQRGLCSYA